MKQHRFRVTGRTASTRVLVAAALLAAPAIAAASVSDETQFVFNTFSFLIWGALVMWMCAGFTMLESGSVRTKNASVICLKNIGLYSIAGLMYFFVGYNLMYVDVSGWIGSFNFFYGPSADEVALLGGDESAQAAVVENGYSTMSDWFFQMVFVATTASIVSGTLAERVKLWSFFLFTAACSPALSIPWSAPGPGAAAGSPRWASRTSPVPPSFTPPAAGRPWPAPWWSARGSASSAPTAPPGPRCPPTFRS